MIIVWSNDFKNMVQKISTCVYKGKKGITEYKTVRIIAKDNKIYMQSCKPIESMNNMVLTICEDAEVYDAEDFRIAYKDLEKISKIKCDEISIRVENHMAVFICGKKKVTFMTYAWDEEWGLPENKDIEKLMAMDAHMFSDIFNTLEKFTSKGEFQKVMNGIYLNLAKSRMESMDGHRIALREIEADIQLENNINIPSSIAPVIKKCIGKNIEKIIVEKDGDYAILSGKDFKLCVKQIEGDYFNVDKMIDFDSFQRAVFNTKEVVDVMEFDSKSNKYESAYVDAKKKKTSTKIESKPVILSVENDNVNFKLITPEIKVEDEICVKDSSLHDGFRIGFNPEFCLDALNTFDDEEFEGKFGKNSIAPMILSANNWTHVVLPISIE